MLRAADKRLRVGDSLSDAGLRTFRPGSLTTISDLTGSSYNHVSPAANAAADTKAATWTTIVDPVPVDCDGFYLMTVGNSIVDDILMDIGVGASSSEVAIVSNLLLSGGNGNQMNLDFYVPLPLAKGTRLSARTQSSDGSAAFGLSVQLASGELARRMRMSRATTYGADTSDSGGVTLDPGGSANTEGGWTEISSALTNRIRYMLLCVGSRNNGTFNANTNAVIELAVGANGAEVAIAQDFTVRASTADDNYSPVVFSRIIDIPAGVRLSGRVRSTNTDATDRLLDVAVVGFD